MLEFNSGGIMVKDISDMSYLCIPIPRKDRHRVREAVASFSLDKLYTVIIKLFREKRSHDANSFFWVITDKIAQRIRGIKEDVYREIIRDVGVFEIVPVREDAAERWVDHWKSGGLGRVSEIMGDSKLDGYVKTINYFGSSCYNTAEMSRLIDRALDEAKSLEIEIEMDKYQIDNLIKNWGKQ